MIQQLCSYMRIQAQTILLECFLALAIIMIFPDFLPDAQILCISAYLHSNPMPLKNNLSPRLFQIFISLGCLLLLKNWSIHFGYRADELNFLVWKYIFLRLQPISNLFLKEVNI